jgi:hypothetical protein
MKARGKPCAQISAMDDSGWFTIATVMTYKKDDGHPSIFLCFDEDVESGLKYIADVANEKNLPWASAPIFLTDSNQTPFGVFGPGVLGRNEDIRYLGWFSVKLDDEYVNLGNVYYNKKKGTCWLGVPLDTLDKFCSFAKKLGAKNDFPVKVFYNQKVDRNGTENGKRVVSRSTPKQVTRGKGKQTTRTTPVYDDEVPF